MGNDDGRLTGTGLDQLARSIAIDGSLGRYDAQLVAETLWKLATRRRHPTKFS